MYVFTIIIQVLVVLGGNGLPDFPEVKFTQGIYSELVLIVLFNK